MVHFARFLVSTLLLVCTIVTLPETAKAAKSLAESKSLSDSTVTKIREGKRLNRSEVKEIQAAEKAKYLELRNRGADEVSNTQEAALLRNYKLRSKKRKGLIRKREASLAEVLFPGVAPVEYELGEPIAVYVDLVESRKRPVPYEFYDLPVCDMPKETITTKYRRDRKNLGSRLQGHDLQVSPYQLRVKKNQGCTPICATELDTRTLKWVRRMIKAQYRVQLLLDQLPVLMRSKEYNYAVRGYPLGFQAPPSFKALKTAEYYFFNHLRFVITYHEDPAIFKGVRITGFDVSPMSIQHDNSKNEEVNGSTGLPTCDDEPVVNDPSMYVHLHTEGVASLPVIYSYEVEWVSSPLPWTDRWDVYLIGAPDDDLHYFSIVNSLMIVLFLTGAIATIMVRTLRKDIAVYNEMDTLEEAQEETGWKLVHGDVFRPPQTQPMLLCIFVGTGAQIGLAFMLAMVAAVFKLLNPVKKGQTLTALIILYVLCGSLGGYVSSRLYKFTQLKKWKLNLILTAGGLPGCLVVLFVFLNTWLSFAGAATAASFLDIVKLFSLWVCVSTPLVFVGGYFGSRAERIEVPTKTNQIARVVPATPWHVKPHYTIVMGGILPFGSVCIELAFIMSALWLHQIYYVMGFLLAVFGILVATCAQVSIVLTYLQLCAEDHRWWWNSFWSCSSSGFYLFLYSLWFLTSRLEVVGLLPVVVYVTYMGMISLCFGLVCGSVGFMASFWFNRMIYGAVKVD